MSRKETTCFPVTNIGVSRQALNDYCAGNSVPDANNLTKRARYFRVSADWLLGLTDYENGTDTVNLVSAYTGLYPNSIKTLHSFKEEVETKPGSEIALSLVDCIITNSLEDFRNWAHFAAKLHNDKRLTEERLNGALIRKIPPRRNEHRDGTYRAEIERFALLFYHKDV